MSNNFISEKNTNTDDDFMLIMIPYFAEILTADVSDQIKTFRFTAMKEVQKYLRYYQEMGYISPLISTIAKKKCELICTVTSKKDLNKIIKPHCPHYDGNKFVPDKYSIPEEELICWSQTSLKAPLNDVGFKRYLELFKEIFPEKSKFLPI